MIVVDTSALIAILLREPDEETFLRRIVREEHCLLSAVNWIEASLVLEARKDASAVQDMDAFLFDSNIRIEPLTRGLAERTRQAYFRFGKGHHPASLNFGDCFAYALAREYAAPLLYKGNDFARTDVISALK